MLDAGELESAQEANPPGSVVWKNRIPLQIDTLSYDFRG